MVSSTSESARTSSAPRGYVHVVGHAEVANRPRRLARRDRALGHEDGDRVGGAQEARARGEGVAQIVDAGGDAHLDLPEARLLGRRHQDGPLAVVYREDAVDGLGVDEGRADPLVVREIIGLREQAQALDARLERRHGPVGVPVVDVDGVQDHAGEVRRVGLAAADPQLGGHLAPGRVVHQVHDGLGVALGRAVGVVGAALGEGRERVRAHVGGVHADPRRPGGDSARALDAADLGDLPDELVHPRHGGVLDGSREAALRGHVDVEVGRPGVDVGRGRAEVVPDQARRDEQCHGHGEGDGRDPRLARGDVQGAPGEKRRHAAESRGQAAGAAPVRGEVVHRAPPAREGPLQAAARAHVAGGADGVDGGDAARPRGRGPGAHDERDRRERNGEREVPRTHDEPDGDALAEHG